MDKCFFFVNAWRSLIISMARSIGFELYDQIYEIVVACQIFFVGRTNVGS